jgi:hypothetical protein
VEILELIAISGGGSISMPVSGQLFRGRMRLCEGMHGKGAEFPTCRMISLTSSFIERIAEVEIRAAIPHWPLFAPPFGACRRRALHAELLLEEKLFIRSQIFISNSLSCNTNPCVPSR